MSVLPRYCNYRSCFSLLESPRFYDCIEFDACLPYKTLASCLPHTRDRELDDFPLDRQLLNIRFGASVPPTSRHVFDTDSTTLCGHVGGKYASFLRYKVEEHLMVNEEWTYIEPVEILDASEPALPPHYAIRLERKLERSIQTVFVPQFLIVSCKSCMLEEFGHFRWQLRLRTAAVGATDTKICRCSCRNRGGI